MKKVDVKAGDITYSQRIELGQILTNTTTSEFEKFRATMLCLDEGWKISDLPKSLPYFEEVLEGIKYWIDKEKKDLKYNPTAEEIAAGIDIYSSSVGEMNTVMALAKDYAKDPDEILSWKYKKVMNILFTNLQSFLYKSRLEKQMSNKAKREAKKHKRYG